MEKYRVNYYPNSNGVITAKQEGELITGEISKCKHLNKTEKKYPNPSKCLDCGFTICPDCDGNGRGNWSDCKTCNGTGVMRGEY